MLVVATLFYSCLFFLWNKLTYFISSTRRYFPMKKIIWHFCCAFGIILESGIVCVWQSVSEVRRKKLFNINNWIHRFSARMTWTMQLWIFSQKQKEPAGLHPKKKRNWVLCMLPPDRLRRYLELQLAVEIMLYYFYLCGAFVCGQ